MAYDGSIKIDTKVDTGGFSVGIDKLKGIAKTGVTALTTTLAGVSAAIGAGATASVNVGSSFESAMSKVSAISGSTGDDLQALTDKAKEMGASTKFSASESAEALQYMAMAGWDTESMLDGISGIMSLAAADGLDLATTSDIVTDALTAFGLKASDSTHFADVLAKASSSANTNVSMLGESFKYVAPLAGTMGYSVEDVSLALGLMANASVKGSMAGTSLKTALANLSSPTEQMAMVMEEYGISISDAEGNSLPLIDVLKQLRDKFGGLSETEQAAAASTLFGKEAMSGMLAIINASDSDFKNLTENINNADGAAQSMADTMQDNLQGQITILKSSLEGLGIEIYGSMSEPLTEAAVEAQNYVNQLTESFKSDGLTGMITEAGNIFGELVVKAAEQAPKMVEASISFIKAFCKGVSDNSSQLISAAKSVVDTIVNNLVNLLPTSVQKPIKDVINSVKKNLSEMAKAVKDVVKQISQSFTNGGLKSAVETVRNIIVKLNTAVTAIAKTALPILAKAVDIVAGSMKVWLPIVTGLYTAYKAYSIISTVTAFITAHTAAVTAETLAEAASTGAITLKQIAVGVLTGEIGLATAAQYAWNAAMNANPIGLIITAVGLLAGAITGLCLLQDETSDSAERLLDSQNNLAESYNGVFEASQNYIEGISGASNILEGFNDSVILSKEKQEELASDMDNVQTEITEIAKHAKDERIQLTQDEIDRLDELFAKEKELAEKQLAVQEGYQQAVYDMSEDLAANHDLTLEEYESYATDYTSTAEKTRDDTVAAAEEERKNILAEKRSLIGTSKKYTEEWYQEQRNQANEDYNAAVDEANQLCADTLGILQKGYYDRSEALQEYSKNTEGYNKEVETETTRHNAEINWLNGQRNKEMKEEYESGGCDTWLIEQKWNEKIAEENEYHNNKLTELNEDYTDSFSQEQQEQLGIWIAMVGQTQLYGGKMTTEEKTTVDNMIDSLDRLPDESKSIITDTFNGMLDEIKNQEPVLYAKMSNVAGNVLNTLRKVFDIHSPSKKTKEIFRYVMQGGEIAIEDEESNLYKQAEVLGNTFSKKLKDSVSADGLVAKMRSAVSASKAVLASQLTANIVHSVNVTNDENNRKQYLKGDIQTQLVVDGRELAVATSPYISEELAWKGVNP